MRVAVLLDLPASARYHRATLDALDHAGRHVEPVVLTTDTPRLLDVVHTCAGVVIGPGSPYRDEQAVWEVIGSARARGLPLVVTRGVFQHVLVEHARSVVGVIDAHHRESSDDGQPVVSLLACSLADDTISISLVPGTRTASLYAPGTEAIERTTCNYGLNPEFAHIAHEGGMVVTATDDTGEVRAIERTDHPFFVATLFQPQLTSSSTSPHPLWSGFVEACDRTA